MVLDELLSKQAERRTVVFCLVPEAARDLADARQEQERAQRDADREGESTSAAERLAAADARYDAALAEVTAQVVRFSFEAIDGPQWDALRAAHRPTEHQRTIARKAGHPPPEWNVDTFPPALVAAACVEVVTPSGTAAGLSESDATAVWTSDRWNQAERLDLFNAAVAAYMTRSAVELPKDG